MCVCVVFGLFFRYRRDWIGGRVAFRVTCWLSEKGESLSWRDKMNGHTFLPIRKEEEEPEREWSGTWLQLDMEVIYWLIYVCGCSCVSIYTYFFQKILTRDPSKGGRCVHDGSGLTFSVVVKKNTQRRTKIWIPNKTNMDNYCRMASSSLTMAFLRGGNTQLFIF